MAASDYVTISISLTRQPLTRAGFGVPMILAPDCPVGFTERMRVYSTVDDLVTDGFAENGPTYLAASVLLDQEGAAPPQFKVGRVANKPTQKITLTPVVTNNTEYAGDLNGARWTYTSDGTATAGEIVAGLHTAIATVASAQSRSLAFTENANTLDIVQTGGGAAGAFDAFEVEQVDVLGIAQTHTDPGVAADLTAIELADSDFYGILQPFGSAAVIEAIAAWNEPKGGIHFYGADTNDSAILTVADGSATDVAHVLKGDGYDDTAAFYSPSNGDFLAAAEMGLLLPQDPGSENWAMNAPKVVPAALKSNHRANLVAKNCNFCEVLGGEPNTFPGVCASGEYIDVIRFTTWLQVNIQANVIQAIKAQSPKKLAFTDAGIAAIGAAIQQVLNQGVNAGGLTDNPKPTVSVPTAASLTSDQKKSRILPNVSFAAELAGAINGATIRGQVTA